MSEITIINGQPQGLGNKMVTYDGLVDFLEMLKNEIPRMGCNNTILGRSYSFGADNEGQGLDSFLIGKSNHVFGSRGFAFGYENYLGEKTNSQATYSYNFAIGEQNQLYASRASAIGQQNTVENLAGKSLYAMIIGFNNHILGGGEYNFIVGQHNYSYQNNTYLLGKYLRSLDEKSNSDFSFWIGQYNDPKENVVFGIGNGTKEQPSNLFEITNDGQIRLGVASISESKLIMPGGTVSAEEVGSNKMVTSKFDAYDSATRDSWISIDSIALHHTKDQDGEEYGIGLQNRSYYRDEGDGDFYPLNDPDEPVLLNGGLRPVFKPWCKNEMLWVTNIHQNNKDALHINYIDQTALNELYNPHWHIPSTIHFHAGGENTWATLKCNKVIVTGNIHGTANFSGPYGHEYSVSWQLYSSGLYSLQLINDTTLKESGIIYIDVNNTSQTTITIGGVLFQYSQGTVTATYLIKEGDNTEDTITAVQYDQLTVEGEEIKKE